MNDDYLQTIIDALKAALANGDLTLSTIDDADGVMVHAPRELLVSLNKTSCCIVGHVESAEKPNIESIIAAVTGKFKIDPETAASDCRCFLVDLRAQVLETAP